MDDADIHLCIDILGGAGGSAPGAQGGARFAELEALALHIVHLTLLNFG